MKESDPEQEERDTGDDSYPKRRESDHGDERVSVKGDREDGSESEKRESDKWVGTDPDKGETKRTNPSIQLGHLSLRILIISGVQGSYTGVVLTTHHSSILCILMN